MSGSITLDQVAERIAILAVAGNRCTRAGRYTLDALITRHGASCGIPAARAARPKLLGYADCSRMGEHRLAICRRYAVFDSGAAQDGEVPLGHRFRSQIQD